MPEKIRVIHYLNQFFAQIGGEDKADIAPGFREGPTGPGRALQQTLAPHGEVLATFFCGDNYFAEHPKEATEELLRQMARFNPQLLIAGPAFESGRYGVACGTICAAAQERLGIYAVAGMDEENPGVALYRKHVYIVKSGDSVVRMLATLQRMAAVGLKLVQGGRLGKPAEEGYIPRGIKRNAFAGKPPAERAVDMLLAKIRGESFKSEIAAPQFQHIKPAPGLRDLSSAVIALVTDGGLVTEGNPERMEPGRPTRFTTIPVDGVDRLDPKQFDVVHSGYDTALANQDPHRLVPLDVMRELERQGIIGKLHESIHATGGAHAAVENATRIGQSIAERLKSAGVNGVILTST
jgi:glycine reductase complex component B subunit gamma